MHRVWTRDAGERRSELSSDLGDSSAISDQSRRPGVFQRFVTLRQLARIKMNNDTANALRCRILDRWLP